MNISTLRLRPCLCLLIVAAMTHTALAFNLTDHAQQNLARPSPRIAAFEAEDILAERGDSQIVDDKLAANGKSVQLKPMSGSLTFKTPMLQRGTYAVWCIGRSTGKPTEYREPMYVHVHVAGKGLGPDGRAAAQWRMRINYMDRMHQDVAHVYFDVNEPGEFTVRFQLGHESAFDLLVDRLELRDELGNTWKKGFKTESSIYVATPTPPEGIKIPEMFEREEALRRARDIAASFPPRNTLLTSGGMPTPGFYQEFKPGDAALSEPNATRWTWSIDTPLESPWVLSGPTVPVRDELDKIALDLDGGGAKADGAALVKPSARLDVTFGVPPKDDPQFNWGTEKPGPTGEYTAADYAQFKKIPSRWPDDGGGFYTPTAKSGKFKHNFYYNVVAGAFKNRYFSLRAEFCKLADEYYRTGNPQTGFRAAVMLAHWADAFPSIDHTVQGTMNVTWGTYPFNTFTGRHYGSFGKIDYSGWAGPAAIDTVLAYDKLFSVIKDNQLLADAVGQDITWVKSPADVVELIDVKLVQHTFDQFNRMYIRSAELRCPPVIAAVQGNNEAGLAMMRKIVTESDFQFSSLLDTVTTTRSRDTTSFIGSMYYAKGPSLAAGLAIGSVLDFADRYKLDEFANVRRYASVLHQSAQWLIEPYTAGVHVNGVGDVAGPQGYPCMVVGDPAEAQLVLLSAWRSSGDARFAWMLANVYRIPTDVLPEERARLEQSAATVARDPRHDQRTRALEGFGVTMLEQGDGTMDFRRRRSVVMRTGHGAGHSHADQLNLELFSHGIVAAGEFGGRPGYGTPPTTVAPSHCLVTVDGAVGGYGTTNLVADLPGGPVTEGSWGQSGGAGGGGRLAGRYARRFVALIDAGNDDAYLFDVVRAAGGKERTYWFHGNDTDTVDSSKIPGLSGRRLDSRAGDDDLGSALESMLEDKSKAFAWSQEIFSQSTGKAEQSVCKEPLYQAVWPLSRGKEEEILKRVEGMHRFAGGKAPQQTYDPNSPRKFTRLMLLNSAGRKVKNVAATSVQVGYRIMCTGVTEEKAPQDVSTFTAIIEPFAGSNFVKAVKPLKVAPADAGNATAAHVTLGSDRHDTLFHADESAARYEVADTTPLSVEGRYAMASRDKQGVRAFSLVEGVSMKSGDVGIVVPAARHEARIVSVDFVNRRAKLDQSLPAALLNDSYFVMGEGGEPFRITRAEQSKSGTVLHFAKSAEAYSSPVAMMRDRSVAGIGEPEHQVHRWLTNEDHSRGWRIANIDSGSVRWMPTGHRGGATLGGDINWDLVPDTDGDGMRTLTIEAHDSWTEAMRVHVLAVDPALRAFTFDSLNSPAGYAGSRSYAGGVIRNEAGKVISTSVIPGKMGVFGVTDDTPISQTDFTDTDGDGVAKFHVYYFGPGDTVALSTSAGVIRQADNTWLVTANSPVTVTLPGKGQAELRVGETWRKLDAEQAGDSIRVTLDEKALTADTALRPGQAVVRVR